MIAVHKPLISNMESSLPSYAILFILCSLSVQLAFCAPQQGNQGRSKTHDVSRKPTGKVLRSDCMAGQSHMSGREKPAVWLANMFDNCTNIRGSLEISHVKDEDLVLLKQVYGYDSLDPIFEELREISGYLFIGFNNISHVSLPKLTTIWGEQQFYLHGPESPPYTMVVANNKEQFEYANLPSLRVIHNGPVKVALNRRLCYWKNNIDWSQFVDPGEKPILDTDTLHMVDKLDHMYCNFDKEQYKCNAACTLGHCWGPGADMCQTEFRTDCPLWCAKSQCFDRYDPVHNSSKSCCSSVCVGGCTDTNEEDCYECANMRDGNKCVDHCKGEHIYDTVSKVWKKNPNPTYNYGRECVKKCPRNMYVEKSSCVSSCSKGYHYFDNRHCTKCPDGICPKVCEINEEINAHNIHNLTNCTIVNGFINLHFMMFRNLSSYHKNGEIILVPPLTIEDLYTHLNKIQVVEKYVSITGQSGKEFMPFSLEFLSNLHTIKGKELTGSAALLVYKLPTLRHLGLRSLRSIDNGNAVIMNNGALCYGLSMNDTFNELILANGHYIYKTNAHEDTCECDPTCEPTLGCWGPGDHMCYQCKHFERNGTCVNDCPLETSFVQHKADDRKVCKPCDEQCNRCNGTTAYDCVDCVNVRLGDECVSKCPLDAYELNGKCKPCHTLCSRCTGPGSYLGDGGCSVCDAVYFNYIDGADRPPQCVKETGPAATCVIDGHPDARILANSLSYDWTWTPNVTLKVCVFCPFVQDGDCVSSCNLKTHYQDGDKKCSRCHYECDGCNGPSNKDCLECNKVKDVDPANPNKFICIENKSMCNESRPYVDGNVCTADNPTIGYGSIYFAKEHAHLRDNKARAIRYIVFTVVGLLLIFLLAFAMLMFVYRHKFYEQRKQTDLIEGPHLDYYDPNVKPNFAYLRIIKADHLRRGGILGNGAFGIVFKGIWMDETTGKKVPVAIKEVADQRASSNTELLEEAGIMASMDHKHLIKLIGIVCGDQLLVVTPLMPLGCLLSYLHTNRAKIPSAVLLLWCQQIAEGMEYLEQQRFVHRDLAARNVLVQHPYHLRVTDFGLAKMLQYGQTEVFVEGRVPVKWLALECINHQRFTHKSDVWAYGVTVWEILTFGEKPYGDTPIQRIKELLANGERLRQPEICTVDVYLLLIQCWMIDADSRPTFTKLREKMAEFADAPSRYLATTANASIDRLPSYTPSDARDLTRDMLGDEEDLADPNDYLTRMDMPGPSTPVSPHKPLMHRTGEGPSGGAPIRLASNSGSQRYQSDPSKHFNSWLERNVTPTDVGTTAMTTISDGSSNSHLQYDHGNYLVPNRSQVPISPTVSTDPNTTYTDVIDGSTEQSPTKLPLGKVEYYNDSNGNTKVLYVNEEPPTVLSKDTKPMKSSIEQIENETTV